MSHVLMRSRFHGMFRPADVSTGKKPQVPPLRSSEFAVETRGVEGLHAALSTESRKGGRR
jgi:hypothetical protein